MIRYRYNGEMKPPAPFVHVTVINPLTGDRIEGVPAQIDTAADRTVLPWEVAEKLGLERLDVTVFAGLGGTKEEMRTFAARLQLHDLPAIDGKMPASAGEPWVLLGRDVLNRFRILLDGPNLALELLPTPE